jgi:hypothetical protein
VEERGIATLTMSVGHDITEQVRPPRAVFVNFPMGNEIGRPGRIDEQRAIVRGAFTALEGMTEPGTIVDLPLGFDERAPDGRPWQGWVYTKAFREHFMKTRAGTRYGRDEKGS